MKVKDSNSIWKIDPGKDKILLVLPPFWTPQIPPMGISCLKSHLQPLGFKVKTVDVNVLDGLREIYNKYFDFLGGVVSEDKRGNFYNIGHEVLQNHMMAHINVEDELAYKELIKVLVYKTFFVDINDQTVDNLVSVIEEFYRWYEKYLLTLLEKESPRILGLSVFKGNIPTALFTFQLAKKRYPEILTVMGGAIFSQTLSLGTPDFEFFLEKTEPYIDKLIIGEGEKIFHKLMCGELPASKRYFAKEDIEDEMLPLESTEIPDFSDLDLQGYPNLASYASRSCPFQCNFCSETVYWGKYRKKKAKQIISELDRLYEKYGFQLFLMCDSLLNPIINDLALECTRSERKFYWDGYLRADKNVCNSENTLLWRRGGFYRARLGVESGSQRILDLMEKKVTVEQYKTAITNLARAGIKTTTYWIVGYPGETEENFQQTLDVLEELRDDIFEAECNPFGFYLNGQVFSQSWIKENKVIPLYPEESRNMLMLQTWIMDCNPSRKIIYERVNRFSEHCKNLGIPNPYSLLDIYNADERWEKLHKNAVPPLNMFKNEEYIDECKYIKKIDYAKGINPDEIKFDF